MPSYAKQLINKMSFTGTQLNSNKEIVGLNSVNNIRASAFRHRINTESHNLCPINIVRQDLGITPSMKFG